MNLKDRIARIKQSLGDRKPAPTTSREERQARIRELVAKSSFAGMNRERLADLVGDPSPSNTLAPLGRRRRIAELLLKASV